MNILAVCAHPDDIELSCAGTLARYVKEGHSVCTAIFTCGDMGDLEIAPADLAAMRKKESQAAADILGAELLWPAITDELVFPNEEQRCVMIDLLRQTDPDVIFTHSPDDYHPDHRYVSQLVFDSYFQKGLPHLPGQTRKACRFGQAQIYYVDNVAGVGFTPFEYVDITDTFDTKRKMLECHKSQLRAMADLANADILEMIQVQSRFRGYAAGCRYAEGFRRLDAWQRGIARRLLP